MRQNKRLTIWTPLVVFLVLVSSLIIIPDFRRAIYYEYLEWKTSRVEPKIIPGMVAKFEKNKKHLYELLDLSFELNEIHLVEYRNENHVKFQAYFPPLEFDENCIGLYEGYFPLSFDEEICSALGYEIVFVSEDSIQLRYENEDVTLDQWSLNVVDTLDNILNNRYVRQLGLTQRISDSINLLDSASCYTIKNGCDFKYIGHFGEYSYVVNLMDSAKMKRIGIVPNEEVLDGTFQISKVNFEPKASVYWYYTKYE